MFSHNTNKAKPCQTSVYLTFLIGLFLTTFSFGASSNPTFSLSFSPSTIQINGISTATFTIDNSVNVTGVSDVDFTASFPAGLVIAPQANAFTTCSSATYNATANSSSLSFSDARIGAGQSCVVQVDVTSSSVGSYTLTSSDLSTSAGSVAAASDTLTVENTGLNVSAALSASTIQPNEVTTLTYTFDASAVGVNIIAMSLSETFPSGVVLADAPNFSTTCAGLTGSFNGGDTSISLANGTVNAGASCTASIDVTAASVGTFSLSSAAGNYYEQGNFTPKTTPAASPAILNVVQEEVSMVFSSFASPGSYVTLDFEIRNTDRGNDITDLNFTSDLNATLSGLSAISLPSTGFCGAGSTASGTSTLSFSNISLASEATCSFSVTVLVPANAAPGTYTHNTSTINLTRGSATTISAVATTLRVFAAPTLAITNSVTNIAAGDTYTSTFTLTNVDTANAATSLSFTMDIAQILPSASIQTLPSANGCGSGSSFTQTSSSNSTSILSVNNANLAAGASCNFDVVILTPVNSATGDYSFTTSTGSGTVNGSTVPIRPVSSSIHVEAAPSLSLVLSESSVVPGGSYDIQFSLVHSVNSIGDVTNGSFSLDLGAVASGMAVSSGGQADMCGSGSSLSGTTTLSASGITMAPGDTCQFTVTVSVPNDNALVGSKTLTVSDLYADLNSLSLTGNSVSATLLITGLTFSQEFVPSTTLPDSTIISRYNIANAAGADTASSIVFTHNFSNVMSSMQATGLPMSPCGGMISGTSTLVFSGASLAGGSTCTFDVEITVPAGASEGSYTSITSDLSATVDGSNIAINAASNSLTVEVLTVAITSTESTTTSASPIPISINFSRDVIGFEVSDIGVTNGSAVDFSGAGSAYTANINPSSDGNVVVSINAGVANDAIDNTVTNPAAQSLTFTYSSTPAVTTPTVSIGSASASSTNVGPITYTLTYNNADQVILGEPAISLNKTGSANAIVAVSGSGTDSRTVTLSDITGDGTLGISVASNTARHNSGGSAGAAGPSGTFSVDNTKPTVAITDSVAATVNTPFTVTFTFNEAVTGFTSADITANNADVSAFNAVSSSVYTALITPNSQGSVTVDVAAGVASDTVGNTNIVASQHSVTYDTVAPTVTISGPTSDTNAAFTATFTFSEAVTDFTQSDIVVGNGVASNFSATSTSVYTATITPSADGTVTIDVGAGAAQDAATNGNTAATQYSVTSDTMAPTVTISGPTSDTNSAFTATFTFSEAVTGFTQSDIVVGNGVAGNFSATSTSVYTATITPSADGTVTVDVGAGAAQDAATNNNTAATQYSVTSDTTAPTVTISGPTSDTNSAFTATFTFSEAVTGFTQSDIVVGNGVASNFSATSTSVYTATITPSADGTVTVDVGAGAAQDAATNNNTAATQYSVTSDTTAPTVTISGPTTDTNAAFTATFTFSEAVTGFTQSDIVVGNGVASNFSATSTSVYTATITPSADGTVTVDVGAGVAQDAATNGNTAATQYSVTSDTTAPTVTISGPTSDTNSAFTATFTFSEAVTGFTQSDIVVGNGVASNFSATSASVYTATITPSADGTVTVDVGAGVAQDAATNGNTAATQYSVTSDTTAPTVTISGPTTDTNTAFTATFTFSEAVTGFTQSDIVVGNGVASNFSATSTSVYTATITPSADGTVTVDVGAGAAQDAATNGNTAATQYSVTSDTMAPTVTISGPTSDTNSAFTATFTFSEAVTGFTQSDIVVGNGVAGNFSATSTSVYTATITPSADGTVTVDVGAGAAQDAATNNNTAATQYSVTSDTTAPTVTISGPTSDTNSAFTATFTFSEAVTGFTQSDIVVGNGVAGNFSATSTSVYTATITPSADGTVTVDVGAGAAQDAATNNNTAATQYSVTSDTTAPTVTISGPTSDTNSAFTATFTFSEAVTGFTQSDIVVGNGVASNFSATSTSVYTATITPSADGTVTVDVGAGAAQDAATNNNTAATQYSVTSDTTAPTVTISGPTTDTNAAFTATFTFSEAVTGFTQSDIVVGNGVASNFSATSTSVYTATITPSADGTVTVDVGAGVAQDAATNGNTAATQYSVTSDTTAPTVTISGPTSDTNSAFTATFTFSEAVTGFTQSDIVVGNGVASNFSATSASVYTATITPSADGTVTVDVGAGAAQDAATNGNTAATQYSVVYDTNLPSVVISSEIESEATNAAFEVTFTFSESVIGFSERDIVATNASLGNLVTISSAVYNVTVAPLNDGSVTVDIPDNVVQDLSGNGNTAATQFSLVYDSEAPQLLSSTPSHDETGVDTARLQVRLVFSEDVRVNSGNLSLVKLADNSVLETLSLLGASVIAEANTITANFASTLTQNEQYGIVIGSGNITDPAGNPWQGLGEGGLSFTASNEPPGSGDDSATVEEDSEVSIAVLENDEDSSDGLDLATLSIELAPLNGVASVNTDTGEISYAPNLNFNGVDSFTYVIADNQGSFSEPATVSVSVTPVNDIPNAVNDDVSTEEEQSVIISILENDVDVDESSNLEPNTVDAASVVIIEQPDFGELVVVEPAMASEDNTLQVGQVVYTPDVNFFGSDSFTYVISDTTGAVSAPATVTISVGSVNDRPVANNDNASTSEDEAVTIDVIANDTDSENELDVNSVVIEQQGSLGVASVDTNTGLVTYTPSDNRFGTDTFKYSVKDLDGLESNIAAVAVTITSINDAPIAQDDSYSVDDRALSVFDILANDVDPDTAYEPDNKIDITSVRVITSPTLGMVTVNSVTGEISYTPSEEVTTGIDTFTYQVDDTNSETSNTATVRVSLELQSSNLVANDDVAQTNEDTPVTIAVLSNDGDETRILEPTSVNIVSDVSNGTLMVNQDGSITYTPSANFYGNDSFEYTVRDKEGDLSNPANVVVTILPVNDAPVISGVPPTSIVAGSNYTFNPEVSDVDSSNLTFTIINKPTWATFNTQSGQLSGVTSNTDVGIFNNIVITVTDESNASASLPSFGIEVISVATLTPIAQSINVETSEDESLAVQLSATDPNNLPLTYQLVQLPQSGSLSGTPPAVTYTPNENYNGADSFTFTASNGEYTSAPATVSITVNAVNDLPEISGSPDGSVIEGNTYSFTPSVTDVDSDSFVFSVSSQPSWTTFSTSTGQLSGTPSESDVGNYENIVITVTDDADGEVSLAAFSIEVIGKSQFTPTAQTRDVSLNEDSSVSFVLTATDPNDLPLTYQLIQQPQSGVITGVLPTVTYTPNENYAGTDSFAFTASNGEYTSEPAQISIDVLPVNDAPVAFDDEAEVVEGQTVSIDVLANDTDVDVGDILSITRVQAAQGVASIVDDTLSYQAAANFIGTVIVDYTISDTEGLPSSAQVVINVIADTNRESNITLEVPDDVETFATGLVTRVSLGKAIAFDNLDNPVSTSLQGTPFFKPGKHTVVWRAESGDEMQQRSQRVTVHPLITVVPAQRVEEGSTAKVDVFLNGPAPQYPLNIPYTVSGTSDSADHNLSDGVLVIESGTQASLFVETEQDGLEEGSETLVITLNPSNNVGNGVHTITIVEDGVSPQLQLAATQNAIAATTIYPQSGNVEVNLMLLNKTLNDVAAVDWSDSSLELNALNLSSSDSIFAFSPETLSTGIYHVRARVTDVNGLVGFADLTLKLSEQVPQLTSIDSDNDGIPDDEEGYGDSDGDGIPDYLDAANECNIQPVDAENGASFLVEGDSGACFKLGDIAMGSSNTIALDDSNLPPDNETTNVSTVIDFAVSGLTEAGQSYRVVIPQRNIIPDGAMYRKYDSQLEAWKNFDSSGVADFLHSAKGEQGICPPPGDSSYTEGLTVGHWCVQLTISDGGPNDDDGTANGMIVDPSGLVVLASDNNPPVANDDVLRFDADSAVVLNVLDNDNDADGDTLMVISAEAYLGQAEISNSELMYIPPENFVGTDTLVYAISDGNGGTASASAQLTVNVNNVPQAEDDTAQTDNQTAVVIDVLANDTDADGDSLAIVSADVDSGSVSIIDNMLTYTPELGFTGIATINYQVEDDKGARASAIAVVTVTSRLNQAPDVQDDSASTNNESSITVNVLANDSDPDGDDLTLVSVDASVGSASIENNQIVYVPQNNFVGTAVVTYVVTDGEFEVSATLTINVTSNATAPEPKKSGGGSFNLLLMLLLMITLMYRLEHERYIKYQGGQ